MTRQRGEWVVLLGLVAMSVFCADVRPGWTRIVEPPVGIVLASGPVKHLVKAGESINLLALRYGVSAAAILRANPGLTPTRLQIGKTILIPSPTKTPAAAVAPKPVATPAPPEAKGIELRPEKAPQATQPLSRTAPAPAAPAGKAETPAAPPALPVAASGAVERPAPTSATPAPQPSARPKVEDIWPKAQAASAARAIGAAELRLVLANAWLLGLFGVLGLFVVVAGRDLLANGAAGIGLRVLRVVSPGQTVRIGACVGRVTARGLFFLELRTMEGEAALFPNADVFRTGVVVLPGNMAL